MKKILLLMACVINIAMTMQAENELTYLWAKLADGAAGDTPKEIKVNQAGDYFIFTNFTSNASNLTSAFGEVTVTGVVNTATSGNANFVLYKTNASGEVIWRVNSNMGDVATASSSVAPTIDGGALIALKLRHTNRDEPAQGIILSVVNNDNSTSTIEKAYSGNWNYEAALIKVNREGNVEWTKLIEVDHTQLDGQTKVPTDGLDFYAATIDVDGNYYLAGRFRCTVTIDGQTLTPRNIEGWTGDSQTSNGDLFVWKMNKDGNLVWSLTTTGESIAYESVKCLEYSGGFLYLAGLIKGDGQKSVKLGEVSLTPNSFLNTFAAKIDTDKNVKWAQIYPSTAFTDGKSNNQLETLCVRKGIMLIGGALKGGITSNNVSVTSETASLQGYILKCSPENGTLQAAASQTGNGISKITGTFITNDKLMAYGYTMSTSFYLDCYDWNLENVTKNNIVTGGGACTSWGAALYNGTALFFGRGSGTFALSGTASTFATQDWGGLVAAYTLPFDNTYEVTYMSDNEIYQTQTYGFGETIIAPSPTRQGYKLAGWENLPETMPGMDITVKAVWKQEGTAIRESVAGNGINIYTSDGRIIVETQNSCFVNVFSINGQLLRTVNVDGTAIIDIPQGIYLINGQKIVVR